MRASNGSRIALPLRRAADQFSRWRNAHDLGTRIPARLWQLAVNLAVTYGVSRTASALTLDYYSLKRRLTDRSLPSVPVAPSPHSSAFVELPASTFSPWGECVIELEKSNGEKIRICWKGAAPDFVGLSRSFWSEE